MEEILFARQSSGPFSISDTEARTVGVNTDVDIGFVAASIARRISCARAAFVEEILFARESRSPASGVIGDTDARMVRVNTDVDIGFVVAIARATFIARDCVKKIFESQRSQGNMQDCILR